MVKSLKEQKAKEKDIWESCFEKKIEDKFTEKGLKKFWDDNTPIEEAKAMLLHAAIDDLVGHLLDSLEDSISAVGGCKDKDEENDNTETEQFQVFNTIGHYFYDDVFTSVDDAKAFIKKRALNTKYTLADFKVVKVYD